MAISKVILNGTTLMDVTDDTVTAETLLQNETATRRDGVQIVGTLSGGGGVEVDPIFSASAAATISSADIVAWNSKSDFSGSYNDLTDKPSIPTVPSNISSFTNDIGYVTSSEAAAAAPVQSVNDQTGTVTIAVPSKTSELENDSNYMSGMTILSYGHSTWAEALTAYNAKHVVYCRASSNSNPASGAQTRMAFLAYINADPPTNMEFQYYRSVNSHSATQQGDQMYVYKIESNGTWSVTVRESYTKIVAGTGLSSSYSNGTLTLNNSQTVPSAASATPADLGTAAVGTSTDYARADHVHKKPVPEIPMGEVDSTSTSTAFTATVSQITTLTDGVKVYLKNNKVRSAANCTLNINELGAKPIYDSRYSATCVSTGWLLNSTAEFIYNSSRVSGGCWDMYMPTSGLPTGGYSGYFLRKTSSNDFDVSWQYVSIPTSKYVPAAYIDSSYSYYQCKYIQYDNTYFSPEDFNVAAFWMQIFVMEDNEYDGDEYYDGDMPDPWPMYIWDSNYENPYPIYINGSITSASNHTLPSGFYFVYFDGQNFQFRTDGKLPGIDSGLPSGGTTGQSLVKNSNTDGDVAWASMIPKPASASSGQFLVYDGTDWVAQSLSTWQGGNY